MKEKSFKRWLSLALAVLMIITAVPLAGGTFEARAEGDSSTEGYYTYTVENGEATIIDCDESISGDVVIPDVLGGYPVTRIGYSAFSGCESIETVTIPDSITEMGREAFFGCHNLKEANLGKGLNEISMYAFSDCSKLNTIVIPDNIDSIEFGAFSDCTSLKSVTIGEGTTRISTLAFENCTNLKKVFWNATEVSDYGHGESWEYRVFYNAGTAGDGFDVVFGDNVTVIPEKAFFGCYGDEMNPKIKSATIGKSVSEIGESAFECCHFLKSITIPESVSKIGSNAFKDCTDLSQINWDASNCNIGNDIFSNVGYISGGTDVEFGNHVIQIPSYLFSVSDKTCIPKIKSITIKSYYGIIGTDAFRGCTELTNLTIDGWMVSISDFAFAECVRLTNITINSGICFSDLQNSQDPYAKMLVSEVTASLISEGVPITDIENGYILIDTGAFFDCTSLKNITVSDNTIIRKNVFDNTAYYNSGDNWENDVLYIGNHLIEAKDSISGTYEVKDGTKTIIEYAFNDCTDLTSITIPDGVTSIGERAFYGCTGLTSITIPDSVTSIGFAAFRGCTSLTSITIPDSVTYIGDDAFYNCTGLTSVTIGNRVTSIGNDAFSDCTGLTSVIIPDSVTSIGYGAFRGCTGLTSITISDSVTSIGQNAFSGTAYYNNSDNWENGVLYIGKHLIKAKETISGANEIKDGTKMIADYAFEDCIGLTSITIPDSVTSIGDSAFSGCTGLTSVTIGNRVTSIGNDAFSDCTGLTSITIPDSVTSIGSSAFRVCTGLTSITIPDSVTSIGGYAFEDCTGLTSITIPSSVTNIGDYALGYYYNDEYEKIDNFTIYGYPGTAAETYAAENGFTFISLDEEHTHSFSAWTVTKEATCTEEGEETRSCSCGETQTRKTEKKAHELNHVENKSTCKIKGVSYDICADCGETFNYAVLPLTSHTFGEWKVTKEATSFEFGERVRTCSVCGFEESEKIEKLPVSEVKDEKTGVSVVCPDGSFDGKVEIEVAETFDGTSYNILNNEKGNFQNRLFDISTLVDGKKAQPNGTVMVKIPLPDGYNPDNTVVYYITNDGKLEKMESKIENGYIIFETTHFSFYAIVDETEKQPENPSENCSCACHKKGIAKFFFKIKLFFQRIFKKNKLCKCGVNHY